MKKNSVLFGFIFLTFAVLSQKGKVEIIKDARIDGLVKKQGAVIPPATSPQVPGYRVQLFFDSDRKAIDDARSKFIAAYPKIDSYVLFNCALQDWFSNTVSECGSLGGIALYPAYRSFPEVFANNHNHLYVPWSLDDAIIKLDNMFKYPEEYSMKELVKYADGTIDRTIDIFEGNGEHLSRNTLDYRKHVAVPKYNWK